jgi:hypothetical protein
VSQVIRMAISGHKTDSMERRHNILILDGEDQLKVPAPQGIGVQVPLVCPIFTRQTFAILLHLKLRGNAADTRDPPIHIRIRG